MATINSVHRALGEALFEFAHVENQDVPDHMKEEFKIAAEITRQAHTLVFLLGNKGDPSG